MSEPLIEFRDYSFRYAAQAAPTLRGINLTIREGEKILVAGASGSGKSTLAGCMNGLIPFSYPGESTGSLLFAGKDATQLDMFERSRLVGTVLQDPDGQFVGLTVGEDIAFALENDCVPPPELQERTQWAACRTGMEHRLKSGPQNLSGGQKQRVALAGVLVRKSRVLLFDEPLANLDPESGQRTVELIDRLCRETGAAAVIIEHRLEEALRKGADRIVLMGEGRIIADLPPNELLSSTLLREYGIREPLYLTALRYAGCSIAPESAPSRLEIMRLEDSAERVRAWFRSIPEHAAPVPNGPLLRVENLTFGYESGGDALKNVTFSIGKGEMISVAGRNGAGKSTLSKLICGFEIPDAGRILIKDRDLAKDSIEERAQHIGYVMQNPNQMISQGTVSGEVSMGLTLRGFSAEETAARTGQTLKLCGLYGFRHWPVSALSFGQKKRLTIASVLVLQPEILILDEPTAGQDFRHYTEIMEFLRELNTRGVTVLMITHDMHLMLEYTARALIFTGGELVADEPPASVLTNPELIRRASLLETSLYRLAQRCGISDHRAFVQRFINYDRTVREQKDTASSPARRIPN